MQILIERCAKQFRSLEGFFPRIYSSDNCKNCNFDGLAIKKMDKGNVVIYSKKNSGCEEGYEPKRYPISKDRLISILESSLKEHNLLEELNPYISCLPVLQD